MREEQRLTRHTLPNHIQHLIQDALCYSSTSGPWEVTQNTVTQKRTSYCIFVTAYPHTSFKGFYFWQRSTGGWCRLGQNDGGKTFKLTYLMCVFVLIHWNSHPKMSLWIKLFHILKSFKVDEGQPEQGVIILKLWPEGEKKKKAEILTL